ncbi:hypothetical protein ACE41H_14165 [Paenibacillus enshidis]|uniref:Uncharacterized protein n=1 Tax=Paenibacillus enshidis TaxID=1458439 RepID=A0ABV5AV68_9BACL
MCDDGKVVLEVKEVLDYLGIRYEKWREFSETHETHFQDQAEDPKDILPERHIK